MSLCWYSFMCVHHSIFYVCVTCCDLGVTISKSHERRREGRTTTSHMYHPKENWEPLAVSHLLFLTSNLQLPPTVYNWKHQFRQIYHKGLFFSSADEKNYCVKIFICNILTWKNSDHIILVLEQFLTVSDFFRLGIHLRLY